MKWEKPSKETLDLFEEVVPDGPMIERRKMFGLPCAFINNNMFIGVFKQTLFIRLSEEDRNEFLRLPDASRFEPMPGRTMKEYVVIPDAVLHDDATLSTWIQRSVAYTSSLPPKEKKKKKKQ
jgi:TfoX/Sxy family transcriptional regulator of competence genes